MRELFVYYRIRDGAAPGARAAIATMHEELRGLHPGLIARLLTRGEESGAATWMETYAMRSVEASVGIDATIENAIADRAANLARFIDGPRHVEAFHAED